MQSPPSHSLPFFFSFSHLLLSTLSPNDSKAISGWDFRKRGNRNLSKIRYGFSGSRGFIASPFFSVLHSPRFLSKHNLSASLHSSSRIHFVLSLFFDFNFLRCLYIQVCVLLVIDETKIMSSSEERSRKAKPRVRKASSVHPEIRDAVTTCVESLPTCLTTGYVVYLLRCRNPGFTDRSYVGCTNNLVRRLKQHNGLLAGGSKYAGSVPGPWLPSAVVRDLPDKSFALRLEWWCKAKHYNGSSGRGMSTVGVAKRRVWLVLKACERLGIDPKEHITWIDRDFYDEFLSQSDQTFCPNSPPPTQPDQHPIIEMRLQNSTDK